MAYILRVEDGEVELADELVAVEVVLAHAGAVQEVLEPPSAQEVSPYLLHVFTRTLLRAATDSEGDTALLPGSLHSGPVTEQRSRVQWPSDTPA